MNEKQAHAKALEEMLSQVADQVCQEQGLPSGVKVRLDLDAFQEDPKLPPSLRPTLPVELAGGILPVEWSFSGTWEVGEAEVDESALPPEEDAK